jgi:hypothetical protein
MNIVQIQPVMIFPETATQLQLMGASVRRFGEGGDALISWQLSDSSGKLLKVGVEELNGEDYQMWNDDLPYLTNWLLDRLGLTAA